MQYHSQIPSIMYHKQVGTSLTTKLHCNCNLFAVHRSKLGYSPMDIDIVIHSATQPKTGCYDISVLHEILNINLSIHLRIVILKLQDT
jgi:uncharacterized Zn finger protein